MNPLVQSCDVKGGDMNYKEEKSPVGRNIKDTKVKNKPLSEEEKREIVQKLWVAMTK